MAKKSKVKLWNCNSKIHPILGYIYKPAYLSNTGLKEMSITEIGIKDSSIKT